MGMNRFYNPLPLAPLGIAWPYPNYRGSIPWLAMMPLHRAQKRPPGTLEHLPLDNQALTEQDFGKSVRTFQACLTSTVWHGTSSRFFPLR